jgi:hypothetical protein
VLTVDVGNGDILTSDQLVLNSDGSYADQATYSNAPSRFEQGTWFISNNLITFNDQTDGIQYTGSLSGNVLTESFQQVGGGASITEVYQRQ